MIAQADAIDKALNYASSRLGILSKTSIAEQEHTTGHWNVCINGEQEEEMLMVAVQLNVQVYEDTNGDAKCRLLMPPIKTEDVIGQVVETDFFDETLPTVDVETESEEETAPTEVEISNENEQTAFPD